MKGSVADFTEKLIHNLILGGKMIGKKRIILLASTLFMIFILSCLCSDSSGYSNSSSSASSGKSSSNSSTGPSNSKPIYQITRETGLYKSLTSSDYSKTLTSGTRVKPAYGSSSLNCQTVDEYGVKITSCNIEVVNTGETGWVLKNALGN